MRPRAADESRSPFLLLTVVSVTRPHWSETPIASSLPFGVLMCVVKMLTQPVSLVDPGADACGSETSSDKRHAALELCAHAGAAPRVTAINPAATNATANAFFISTPLFLFPSHNRFGTGARRAAAQALPHLLLRRLTAKRV